MAGRMVYTGGIVTNGLVLNLDAAKRDSYPGSGTVWRDIAGSSVIGTLTNGPTFSSDNGGNIVFDGTNDFVNIPSFAGVTSLTMECFIKTNDTNFKTFLYGTSQASSFCPRISFRSNTINLYFQSVGTGDVIFTFGSINTGTIYHIAYTFDSTSGHNCYLNTVLGTRTSTSTGLNGVPSFTNLTIGQGAGSDGFFSGNFYGLRIYNRALSLSEITQNYNALKGRFGL